MKDPAKVSDEVRYSTKNNLERWIYLVVIKSLLNGEMKLKVYCGFKNPITHKVPTKKGRGDLREGGNALYVIYRIGGELYGECWTRVIPRGFR